jgi:hypothetical protein
MLVFDIETGPLPDDMLKRSFEYPEPPQWVDFDPESVRYGNTTDPEKRARKLADERDKHNAAQRRRIDGYEQEKQVAWESHKRDAGLSAATGRVLAVGFTSLVVNRDIEESPVDIVAHDEYTTIEHVFDAFTTASKSGAWSACIAGHNILEFDLPFLVRRAWILGVPVPRWIRDGRYWSRAFLDTRELWQLGNRQAKSSLNHVCQALGIPGKLDGVDGSQFAKLWETDREKAKEYLTQDVRCTAAVVQRLTQSRLAIEKTCLTTTTTPAPTPPEQQPEPAGGTQTEASDEVISDVEDDDIF